MAILPPSAKSRSTTMRMCAREQCWYYMRNWARRLATPSTMRKMWKQAEGQRNSPLRLRAVRWIAEGKTNTRAKPHAAPEYLHRHTHTYFRKLLEHGCTFNSHTSVFYYLQVCLQKWDSIVFHKSCLFFLFFWWKLIILYSSLLWANSYFFFLVRFLTTHAQTRHEKYEYSLWKFR